MGKNIYNYVKQHLFLLLVTVFFCVYYINIQQLPEKALFLPQLLMYIVIPAVLWNVIASIYDFKTKLPQSTKANNKEKSSSSALWETKKYIIIALILFYLVLVPFLGFFIASSIYMVIGVWLLGIKQAKAILIYILIIDLFLYLTFVFWVGINLPTGILY
jgi:hypothetical protein